MKDAIFAFVSALIPDAVKAKVIPVLDAVESVLVGEPVLVIGNGAAVIIYLVAKASGRIPDVSFDEALAQTGPALVLLNTILVAIRQLVTPVAKLS